MPSSSRDELNVRLKDVAELIHAHTTVTGGGPGKPAQRQGAAITRAGVVLLAACMEAYVEDLYEEAAAMIFHAMTADERKRLFENTSKRLNNADVHKTEMLFFNIGLPWALSTVSWQKFSNETFKKALNKLVETRNQIAHGKQPSVTLPTLRRWRTMVENYSRSLDHVVANHIQQVTGNNPNW